MTTVPASLPTERPSRVLAVDALRGAIMILMAIDHIRDYIAQSAMQFQPTDLTRTTPALFLTRWITHFCAPVFILTAGIGAAMWRERGHRSKRQLSRFLVTRGLWLILLETTILRILMFSQLAYRGQLVFLLILWAIGLSMIALAALQYLPLPLLAVVSAAILLLHNLLDPIQPDRFGAAAPLWDILHRPAIFTVFGIHFLTAYPVLPWIGVICVGYCLAQIFTWEAGRRRRFLIASGLALTLAFVLVRALNRYDDPSHWAHQRSTLFTLLSFLNVTKYPPSLDFLLMTLGPALLALAFFERTVFSPTSPLVVFGRVPFFYYVAHLALAHVLAILLNLCRYGWKPFVLVAPPSMGGPNKLFPPNYGYPLWVAYAVWIVVVVLLYPACLWFSRLKQRRHDWWMSYL